MAYEIKLSLCFSVHSFNETDLTTLRAGVWMRLRKRQQCPFVYWYVDCSTLTSPSSSLWLSSFKSLMHALQGEVLYRNAQLRGGARDVRDGRGEVHGTAEWRHQRCGRHAEEWRRM